MATRHSTAHCPDLDAGSVSRTEGRTELGVRLVVRAEAFGVCTLDYEDDGWMYGPIVGIKHFYSTGISVFAEYQYRLFGAGVGDIIDHQHTTLIGMSFHF